MSGSVAVICLLFILVFVYSVQEICTSQLQTHVSSPYCCSWLLTSWALIDSRPCLLPHILLWPYCITLFVRHRTLTSPLPICQSNLPHPSAVSHSTNECRPTTTLHHFSVHFILFCVSSLVSLRSFRSKLVLTRSWRVYSWSKALCQRKRLECLKRYNH